MTGHQGQEGGTAVYVLGLALMLLLLVAGLGLADAVRAIALKSVAQRSLAAAVQSALRVEPSAPAEREALFQAVLAANLGSVPYEGELMVVPQGSRDPLTGRVLDLPVLSARLSVPFRLQFLGGWAPETKLILFHQEYAGKRKEAP